MRKAHVPIMGDQLSRRFVVDVARMFRVPIMLLGVFPRRDGRPRSLHRHRNRGRA